MTCAEIIFRSIEVVIAASVPVLVVIFGLKLTKRSEEIKNESAAKHLWRTKWIDMLFQKHLAYCDHVTKITIAFISLVQLLKQGKKVNSTESLKLQKEIYGLHREQLLRVSHDLILFSKTTLGPKNPIEQLVLEIAIRISDINRKISAGEQANPKIISDKLINLNRVTEELIQKKFK